MVNWQILPKICLQMWCYCLVGIVLSDALHMAYHIAGERLESVGFVTFVTIGRFVDTDEYLTYDLTVAHYVKDFLMRHAMKEIFLTITFALATFAYHDCDCDIAGITFGPFFCTLTGRKVYLNGLYYRDISDADMSEVTEYRKQLAAYEKAVDEYSGSSWYGITSMNTTIPEYPARPSFCGDNSTVIYDIGDCQVLDDQVFIRHNLVRTLTSEEIQQLKTFYENVLAYKNYIKSQWQQGSYSHNFLQSIFGHNRNPQTTTTTSQPPPKPVIPDICYTF